MARYRFAPGTNRPFWRLAGEDEGKEEEGEDEGEEEEGEGEKEEGEEDAKEVNEELSELVEDEKEELEDFTKAAEKVWDVPQRELKRAEAGGFTPLLHSMCGDERAPPLLSHAGRLVGQGGCGRCRVWRRKKWPAPDGSRPLCFCAAAHASHWLPRLIRRVPRVLWLCQGWRTRWRRLRTR